MDSIFVHIVRGNAMSQHPPAATVFLHAFDVCLHWLHVMWCDALPLTFQDKDAHTKTISLYPSLHLPPSLPHSLSPLRIKMLTQRQPPSLFLSFSSLHLPPSLSPYTHSQWQTFIFTSIIHSIKSSQVSFSLSSYHPHPPPPAPQVLIQPGASFTGITLPDNGCWMKRPLW